MVAEHVQVAEDDGGAAAGRKTTSLAEVLRAVGADRLGRIGAGRDLDDCRPQPQPGSRGRSSCRVRPGYTQHVRSGRRHKHTRRPTRRRRRRGRRRRWSCARTRCGRHRRPCWSDSQPRHRHRPPKRIARPAGQAQRTRSSFRSRSRPARSLGSTHSPTTPTLSDDADQDTDTDDLRHGARLTRRRQWSAPACPPTEPSRRWSRPGRSQSAALEALPAASTRLRPTV